MENVNQKRERRKEDFHRFLIDLKEKTETTKVTSLNPILKAHGLHTQVGTVIRLDDVIKEDGVIKWNSEKEPTKELAAYVEQEYFIYGRWNNKMDFLDNAMKSTEPYPFDFDRLWEDFGFSTRSHAKRSLLNCCENDKDFYLTTNGEISSLFPEKRSDFEVIKISRTGFLKWHIHAQTPVAKDRVVELLVRSAQIYSENVSLKKDRYQKACHELLGDCVEDYWKQIGKKLDALQEYNKKQISKGINLQLDQIDIDFNEMPNLKEIFIQLAEEFIIQLENDSFIPKKARNDISIQEKKSSDEDCAA